MRLIQRKYLIANPPGPDDKRQWTYGLSGHRVHKALQKFKVLSMKNDSYWFADIDDTDLLSILKSFNFDIPMKLYSDGELRRMKKFVEIF